MRFSFPVAQNVHVRLHPIWLLMHAVRRVGVGISTPSTTWPSQVLNAHLMVPSVLFCCSANTKGRSSVRSASCARNALGRSLIASQLWALFFHNHSHNCFAR